MSRAADPATSHQQLLADELLPSLYRELKHMASQQLLSENVNLTLNATALVHEAYLRLSKDGSDTHANVDSDKKFKSHVSLKRETDAKLDVFSVRHQIHIHPLMTE